MFSKLLLIGNVNSGFILVFVISFSGCLFVVIAVDQEEERLEKSAG